MMAFAQCNPDLHSHLTDSMNAVEYCPHLVNLLYLCIGKFSRRQIAYSFLIFFSRKQFMQIVSSRDNLFMPENVDQHMQEETICMQCQSLFSGKIRKHNSKCLLKFLLSILA